MSLAPSYLPGNSCGGPDIRYPFDGVLAWRAPPALVLALNSGLLSFELLVADPHQEGLPLLNGE
jgi:hypothetical protein